MKPKILCKSTNYKIEFQGSPKTGGMLYCEVRNMTMGRLLMSFLGYTKNNLGTLCI